MTAFGFKGGIGTASRRLEAADGGFTVGALVLANFGRRSDLMINGVPVGIELREWKTERAVPPGSSIIVPGDRRADGFTSARKVGQTGRHRPGPDGLERGARQRRFHPGLFHDAAAPLWKAAIEAAEEAIVNALFGARKGIGRDGHVSPALPIDEVLSIMRRYGR